MSNIDLSDYAGLIIVSIVAICAALAYFNYKVEGGSGAGITAMLAVIGGWISIGIVNMADFEDATPETVITISIGVLLLPLLYSAAEFREWKARQKVKRIQDKMLHLQNELKSIEEKINHEQTLIHFVELLKKCNEDVSCFENHPQLSNQRELLSSAEKIKQEIRSLSYELQSGGAIQ